MQDQDLDKVMETWIEHETRAAPKLRPAPRVYRLLEVKRQKPRFSFFRTQWAAMGAAVIALLVVLYAALFQLPNFVSMPASPAPPVGIREGFPADKGTTPAPTPSDGKGPRRSVPVFRYLHFEIQRAGDSQVESVDLTAPQAAVTLTSKDTYRLYFELNQASYVYIFQETASGDVLRLFPNLSYSHRDNPLPPHQPVAVPTAPDGFYVQGTAGAERLDVLVAAAPLVDLNERYDQYIQAEDADRQREMAQLLLEYLDALAATPSPNLDNLTFTFQH